MFSKLLCSCSSNFNFFSSSFSKSSILRVISKKSGAKKVVVAKKVKYKGKIYIITKIKKKAFYKKKNIKKVIIKSLKLKKIGKFAFAKISKKAVIKVPKKKFKKYKKLLKRAKFKGKIVK